MNKPIINSAERYKLFIEDDLLDLIQQAIALENTLQQAEDYSEQKATLENRLYDLYEDIGWSVVYDLRQLPF